MFVVTWIGVTAPSSSASSLTRGESSPSSSPIANVPTPPCWIRPGATQSAAQFTRQPTVRSAPTRAAIRGSLSPFWSDTTVPRAVKRGAIVSRAAAVCCALTASRTRSSVAGRASGVTARTGTVQAPSGVTIVSPPLCIAATWSAAWSTRSTSWPARTNDAPVTPPIAPAPTTVTVMRPCLSQGPGSVNATGPAGI